MSEVLLQVWGTHRSVGHVDTERRDRLIQEYLTHKKHPPPRTLQ